MHCSVRREKFKGISLTKEMQSKEEIVWGMAFWVGQNVAERKFGTPVSQMEQLTDEVLEAHREDSSLQELLSSIEGGSEAQAAALCQALTFVHGGYTRFSSLHDDWLRQMCEITAGPEMVERVA